jgi:hypothetical protein
VIFSEVIATVAVGRAHYGSRRPNGMTAAVAAKILAAAADRAQKKKA